MAADFSCDWRTSQHCTHVGWSWLAALHHSRTAHRSSMAYRHPWFRMRRTTATWQRPRMSGERITAGRTVVQAVTRGERVELQLDDRTTRCVDHVLLGTGYRVDISRYGFLSPHLVEVIDCVRGFPKLHAGLESS